LRKLIFLKAVLMSTDVSDLLGKLTIDEKLAVIGGDQSFFIRALPSIGMPALKMSDGPYGIRTFGRSTAYAAGISLAAAWDPGLARRVGDSMGKDARARGVHFLLAPGVQYLSFAVERAQF
jgi:beta-glucosidase